MNVLRRSRVVDPAEPVAAGETALAGFGRPLWPRFLLAAVALLAAAVLATAVGPAGIPLDATVRMACDAFARARSPYSLGGRTRSCYLSRR